MNPEERTHQSQARPHSLADTRDLAPQDVVDALQRLQTIPVPTSFAVQLEQRLRKRAGALQHQAAFPQNSAPIGSSRLPRAWVVPLRRIGSIAATLLVFVVVGVTIVNASAQSLPGDWLYGLKQWRNQIALGQAQTPAAKAHIALLQMQNALADLHAEVRDQRTDADVIQALTVLATATRTAQAATNAVIIASDRTTAQLAFAQALQAEKSMLYHVAHQGDWSIRLACTAQLSALGAQVPSITAVFVTKQQATITLSIQGTHFASGVQVIMDRQLVAVPNVATSTVLNIELPVSQWGGQDHMVGVQNPDGTGAEIAVANGPPDPSKGHAPPTPVTTPDTHGHQGQTPTPVHGHSGGGE